jgi:hypothetical protein
VCGDKGTPTARVLLTMGDRHGGGWAIAGAIAAATTIGVSVYAAIERLDRAVGSDAEPHPPRHSPSHPPKKGTVGDGAGCGTPLSAAFLVRAR